MGWRSRLSAFQCTSWLSRFEDHWIHNEKSCIPGSRQAFSQAPCVCCLCVKCILWPLPLLLRSNLSVTGGRFKTNPSRIGTLESRRYVDRRQQSESQKMGSWIAFCLKKHDSVPDKASITIIFYIFDKKKQQHGPFLIENVSKQRGGNASLLRSKRNKANRTLKSTI
jgi:hypothetical protein